MQKYRSLQNDYIGGAGSQIGRYSLTQSNACLFLSA
ncbi:hypothetical protein BOTU111921_06700 [Bordetella tumbae]